MSAGERYFRTIIVVEVLGNDPYQRDIAEIGDDITDGMFSGFVLSQQAIEVDASTMARLLISQGSDPSFLIRGDDET